MNQMVDKIAYRVLPGGGSGADPDKNLFWRELILEMIVEQMQGNNISRQDYTCATLKLVGSVMVPITGKSSKRAAKSIKPEPGINC